MRALPLLALAIALAADARAVVLSPVGQSRSVDLLTSAYSHDGQGGLTESDGDGDSDFAVDLGPFVASAEESSATSLASAQGSVSQSSEFLPLAIVAAGALAGTAASVQDGSSGSSATSFCTMTFALDQATTYTLSGSLDGATNATATLTVTGPSGSIAQLQADAQQNHVDVQQGGPAPAGQYILTIRLSGGTLSIDGQPDATSGGFDVTLELAGGAVDAPIPARAPAGPRAVPNPFRESTRIETALPVDAPLRAGVFDVTGREVRSLSVHGADALVWDGRAGSGRRVPAGTYFVRLESPRGSSVLKVVAVR